MVDDEYTWGHSIHMTKSDLKLSQQTGAKHSHCPTSNLFLGSVLFDMKTHIEMGIGVDMGIRFYSFQGMALWGEPPKRGPILGKS